MLAGHSFLLEWLLVDRGPLLRALLIEGPLDRGIEERRTIARERKWRFVLGEEGQTFGWRTHAGHGHALLVAEDYGV